MILDFSQNNMFVIFEITENNNVALKHFAAVPISDENKFTEVCLISDVGVCGGMTDGRFGAKHVEESESKSLKYQRHDYYENEYGNKLEFFLTNGKIDVIVHYQFYSGISAVRSWKTITNVSDEPVGIDYISSFSYTGLSGENMKVLIPNNSWCSETDWEEFSPEMLGMKRYRFQTTKRISVSNTGVCSAKEYLPMGALTSSEGALLWQIENNGSWQWEIGDIDYKLYLKMSGPNEQDNFWYKELVPGESFEGVGACVCIGDDFDDALCAMTRYRRKIFVNNEENKKLPVIFNDYMHCLWADPTEEKMLPMIDKAAELGCEYYCMDAGWYADGTWWETVGEWKEERKRFPNGIKYVFDYIKNKGMSPGIWLEIEVMGVNCPILNQFDDDCFFVRHGKRIVNRGRYQFDFRNEKVRAFATETVKRVVEEYGAEYIKFDYNITPGAGTEIDSDSFGDGLLEHNRAYLDWIREIKEKYPKLILENCSSGGLRMDYAMLKEHHIQSVTDQEEVAKTAYIAATAPTAVLPEQAAIWAYPLKTDSLGLVEENIANALLQRLYLSGQILDLGEKEISAIKDGVELYKGIRGEIAESVPFYPIGFPNRNGGTICVGFEYKNCKRILVCGAEEKDIDVQITVDCTSAKILYPRNTAAEVACKDNKLNIRLPEKCTAVIVEVM